MSVSCNIPSEVLVFGHILIWILLQMYPLLQDAALTLIIVVCGQL